MYREEQPGASFMLGIMTGALIGAGVALLFAPKAGTRCGSSSESSTAGSPTGSASPRSTCVRARRQLRDQGRERVQQLTGQLVRPGVNGGRSRERLPRSGSRHRRRVCKPGCPNRPGAFTC